MDEQRTIEYDDGEYTATATVHVPPGGIVLSGIERLETEHGPVLVPPKVAMNAGDAVRSEMTWTE